jgi:hypothetical protein
LWQASQPSEPARTIDKTGWQNVKTSPVPHFNRRPACILAALILTESPEGATVPSEQDRMLKTATAGVIASLSDRGG